MAPNELPLLDLSVAQCAPSGLSASLGRSDAEQLATLLKAVADPTRLQLLAYINASSGAESCVCDLTDALDLTQPTISHHLKVLTDAGLISREKRGTWVWYSVVAERWNEISGLFSQTAAAASCC